MQRYSSILYSKLAPTDPWCNMLQTLERRRKYIDAILTDKHTLKTGSTVILKITKKRVAALGITKKLHKMTLLCLLTCINTVSRLNFDKTRVRKHGSKQYEWFPFNTIVPVLCKLIGPKTSNVCYHTFLS